MIELLPFYLAMAAIALCWLPRGWWPSWALFLAALLLAYGSWVSLLGLLWMIGAGLAFAAAARGWGHPAAAKLVAFAVGLPLLLYHSLDVPGLTPLPVVSERQVSEGADPFSLLLDFGPAAVGFLYARFFIAPPTRAVLKPMLIWVAGLTLILAALLIALGLGLGYVAWDPKWPSFLPIWIAHNLLLVSAPEEAVFRGLLQDGLRSIGIWGALTLASLLFGLYHINFGLANVGLAAVAGLFFGYAYLRTARLEAAILLHFVVNAIHLLLFTYPRLA